MQSSSLPPRFHKQKQQQISNAKANANDGKDVTKTRKTIQHRNANANASANTGDSASVGFRSFCKNIGVIHYSTKQKYEKIDFIWKSIYQEIQINNIHLNTFDETMSYLTTKINRTPLSKKFSYEYIMRELNNYTQMSLTFASSPKDYIRRLQIYAKSRRCTNMEELKKELTHYLSRYVVEVEYGDKDNKNDYEKQDWLIISRYICDYLEEGDEFCDTVDLFN
jgi:hypothetical protein